MEANTAVTALTTALTSLGTEASSVLATIVPIAIGIAGTVLLVRMGFRWFKGLAK